MASCVWRLSLSVMFPRFIRVVAGVSAAFPFMAEECSIVGIDPIELTCSSLGGHLCCFYLLAIVNSAAVNILIQVFLCVNTYFHLFGYTSRSGIAGSNGNAMLNSLGVDFFFSFSPRPHPAAMLLLHLKRK